MILSVAVSSGFRKELRNGIAYIYGDIRLTSPDMNYINESSPIRSDASYMASLDSWEEISSIVPAIYRAGIVKNGSNIHGVLFKGTPDGGDSLQVSVPRRLADILGLEEGDGLTAYFVGEKVKARKFHVKSVYQDILGNDDKLVVYAGLSDLQRLNGWQRNEVSAIEIQLKDKYRSRDMMREMTQEVGARVLFNTPEDEDTVVASSALNMYPEIFSWLDLIDFNVLFVLILMTIVAGFNMISALLIMLFRNIPVIGLLKSLGMDDCIEGRREKIAGINHMAWLLELTKDGKDVYPQMRKLGPKIVSKYRGGKEKHGNLIRLEMMTRFGYYVTESSEHNAEYAPYWIKAAYPELIDEYFIPLDEYPRRCINQINNWKKQYKDICGNPKLDHKLSREYGSGIMNAIVTNTPYQIGGNVMNNGLITNLPSNAVVEVPCLVDANGVQGTYVGALPPQCAAMNMTNINVQLLTIEAALTLKREHIYHAAMLDPHTSSELNIDDIIAMCDDLIEAHGNMLPKYH